MRKGMAVMLFATAISSLLLLEIQALESPEFTREMEFCTSNGTFVVQSGSVVGGMFRVSLSNRTIDIDQTSSSLKLCKVIVVDPFEDTIKDEIRATFLDNYSIKKTIVIWGVGRSEIVNSNRTISYTMLLVDLVRCEGKAVWLPDDHIHSHKRILQIDRDNNQKFNVYFASQQYCSLCEVNSYGSHTATNKLEAEGAEPADNFHLRPLDRVEDSDGFFYAFNFINGSAVVKLLGTYQPRRIRNLNHRVDVVSVKSSRIRNVGYCYQATQSPNELRCERLDSRLQSVVSVLVPLGQPARKFLLEYDESGNSYVAVVLVAEVRVFIYDIYGELIATLDFGPLQESVNVRDLSAYIDADQYCLFYSIQLQGFSITRNIIKCINCYN